MIHPAFDSNIDDGNNDNLRQNDFCALFQAVKKLATKEDDIFFIASGPKRKKSVKTFTTIVCLSVFLITSIKTVEAFPLQAQIQRQQRHGQNIVRQGNQNIGGIRKSLSYPSHHQQQRHRYAKNGINGVKMGLFYESFDGGKMLLQAILSSALSTDAASTVNTAEVYSSLTDTFLTSMPSTLPTSIDTGIITTTATDLANSMMISATDAPTLVNEELLVEAGKEAVNSLYYDFLTFLAATVAVVPIANYLNITPVLGFLLAGCLLGPHGLGFFSNNESDIALGDIGILFLLFSEGLNLSPDRLRDLGAFYGLGVLQLVISMGLFFCGIVLIGPTIVESIAPILPMDDYIMNIFDNPTQAFCIAAAGALSSSAFVLPVLKDKKWEDRPEGIAALSVLLLQDIAVAPLLVALPVLAGSGPQTSGEIGFLAAKATFGFGAVIAVGSVLLRVVFNVVAAARSTDTFVAAALLVALGMGSAAEFLGLSASTGAFAAGVLLAGNRYRAQIRADVRPFEGILLGVFFLTAGASLDPKVVIDNIPILCAGGLFFLSAKAAILYFAGIALGKTRAQAARVGITLSGGGEFSLVLFSLAKDLDVLPDELYKLLVASVILSMSLTPLLGEIAEKAGIYFENMDGVRLQGYIGASNVDEDGSSEPAPDFSYEEAKKLFNKIDADQSGTIEYEELRTVLLERGLSYASIAEVFVKFDVDGSGEIDRDEWMNGIEAGFLTEAIAMGGPTGQPIPVLPSTTTTTKDSSTKNSTASADIAEDAVVICGYTEFGREMYGVLETSGLCQNGGVVAFDLNPSRVAAGLLSGSNVVYGDGASPNLLRAAGVRAPRAVIVAYRSEAKRLEATSRLREGLPDDTPIYSRCVSGQSLGRKELLDAGATDVVSERTEAALRFGTLLGILESIAKAKKNDGEVNAILSDNDQYKEKLLSSSSLSSLEWSENLRRRVEQIAESSAPSSSEQKQQQQTSGLFPFKNPSLSFNEPPPSSLVSSSDSILLPDLSESQKIDLAEEFDCQPIDIKELYRYFISLPEYDAEMNVASVEDIWDVLLRFNESPVDDETLAAWVSSADIEKDGKLSFVDFARICFSASSLRKQL